MTASTRIRILVARLRMLSKSRAAEEDWKPEVRWVDKVEHFNRSERYRGEEKPRSHQLGDVDLCEYQQDPDDSRHVPKYWKNRLNDQVSRGVHPTVLDGQSEVDWEPLGEAELRFLERRRIDVYAICYPGQFSPVRYRDPLQAIEHLAELCTNERRPERFCRACRAYDEKPAGGCAYRPSGALERSACAGCLVSYVDKLERDPEEVQDERVVAWLTAREKLKDVNARKAHAVKPKDKKRLKREREKAIEALEAAAVACKEAGFDVKTEFKRPTTKWKGTVDKLIDKLEAAKPGEKVTVSLLLTVFPENPLKAPIGYTSEPAMAHSKIAFDRIRTAPTYNASLEILSCEDAVKVLRAYGQGTETLNQARERFGLEPRADCSKIKPLDQPFWGSNGQSS